MSTGPDTVSNTTPPLEMAHVLFMDIVAYSKLPMDEQTKRLGLLQQSVRNTQTFEEAKSKGDLISLPTGDGMALVFFGDPELPVRCALELSRTLHQHLEIKLRMGIHTGPVYRVADINAASNVAGGGINLAQRVMDCGDAGHILASVTVAEVLTQISRWIDVFHDLGEAKVKHDVRVHIYNVYTKDIGNPGLPQKVGAARQAEKKRRKRRSLEIIGAAVMVMAGMGWLWFSRAHKVVEKSSVVLSDFINTTGDSVFDDTLRQGLSIELEQAPFLELVSESKMRRTLRLMGRSPDDRLTPMVTREICERVGSKAMLTGSIALVGNQYVIGLKAVSCDAGDVLAETQEQASGKEEVLKVLAHASVTLRGKLGESLSSVQKYAPPVEVTTTSLEALEAYSLGRRMRWTDGDAASLPFFQRAVRLDPNLASAYVAISYVYSNRNELGLAAENARKAYELRDRVTEGERLGIEATYYLNGTGELEKAAQLFELWRQTYPNEDSASTNLVATYATLGNLDKELIEARRAMELEPNNIGNYINLGNAYTSLNRLDEAETVYKQAEERKLGGDDLLQNRYLLAFLKHDKVQMAAIARSAMGKPGTEDVLLAAQADTDGWFGRLRGAREFTKQATDSAKRNNAKETASGYEVVAALREVESGNRERALAAASSALKLGPNRDVQALAAIVMARADDIAGAEKTADSLNKTFPLDTVVQGYYLPAIRASVALQRKDPKRAVEVLRMTSVLELGQTSEINAFLLPVYLRGQAYLMLADDKASVAEFQKFIEHSGLVTNFPWGALARLGLARAYALNATQDSTSKVAARAVYGQFLELWKDADRDVPILIRAKKEYAKLQ